MKKTYQNPETKIVKVQTAKMIAASDFNQALGGEGTGGDGGKALSRRGGSVWDDDESEDY